MSNYLKSEQEVAFAKEKGKEVEYTNPQWFKQWQINRFFLYILLILLAIFLGSALQGLQIGLSSTEFHISFAAPKFETYSVFNWVLQIAWWLILVIIAIFATIAICEAAAEERALEKRLDEITKSTE